MRTTITIDDDVLAAAKQFADVRGITLGEAVSQLARATLTERKRFDIRNGIVHGPRALVGMVDVGPSRMPLSGCL